MGKIIENRAKLVTLAGNFAQNLPGQIKMVFFCILQSFQDQRVVKQGPRNQY